jgi:hypothetical protein
MLTGALTLLRNALKLPEDIFLRSFFISESAHHKIVSCWVCLLEYTLLVRDVTSQYIEYKGSSTFMERYEMKTRHAYREKNIFAFIGNK